MLQIVLPNKKGLTLVEVMIALVVLLIISLALMQTALVSIDSNMTNILRDEAVNIAEERMTIFRSVQFNTQGVDPLLADTNGTANSQGAFVSDTTVQKNVRNISNFTFTSTKRIDDLGSLSGDNKQVDIEIAWTWKGQNYNHVISTILRRQ
jgi:prepilin-type N-terminal cleavage/methylation domain-containing protein